MRAVTHHCPETFHPKAMTMAPGRSSDLFRFCLPSHSAGSENSGFVRQTFDGIYSYGDSPGFTPGSHFNPLPLAQLRNQMRGEGNDYFKTGFAMGE